MWVIGIPLAYFYTTVPVLNHRKYSGCYMYRDPISPGFAGTVPVLWVLSIVAAKQMVGGAKCPGFQQITKKKYEIVENAQEYFDFHTVRKNIYSIMAAISHLVTERNRRRR